MSQDGSSWPLIKPLIKKPQLYPKELSNCRPILEKVVSAQLSSILQKTKQKQINK